MQFITCLIACIIPTGALPDADLGICSNILFRQRRKEAKSGGAGSAGASGGNVAGGSNGTSLAAAAAAATTTAARQQVCPLRYNRQHCCQPGCPGYVNQQQTPAALAAAAAYAANPHAVHTEPAAQPTLAIVAGPRKPTAMSGIPYLSFKLKAKVAPFPARIYK